jgi:hypothetical protein
MVLAVAFGGGTLHAQNPLEIFPNPARRIAELQREVARARAEAERQRQLAEDARRQAEAEKARAVRALKEAQRAVQQAVQGKAAEGKPADKPANETIKALLKERFNQVQQIVVVEEKAFEAGQGSPELLFLARQELMITQLEAAADNKQRQAILETFVAFTRKIEQGIEQQQKVGAATLVDLLWARTHRIDAEIALERVKAAQASEK